MCGWGGAGAVKGEGVRLTLEENFIYLMFYIVLYFCVKQVRCNKFKMLSSGRQLHDPKS